LYTIAVAGFGNVGSSLVRWFSNHTDHKIKIYDPIKGFKDKLKDSDFVFICVPVPTRSDNSQDTSILEDVVDKCQGSKGHGPVIFVRSTVLPGTCDRLGVFAMPEFFTERYAHHDAEVLPILCGLNEEYEVMQQLFPGKEITYMTNNECEMTKYAHNCFGAMKINYFNIIYDACKRFGCSYEKVKNNVFLTGFINPEHTTVPGHDGQFGFGGHCLPKDLSAFYGLLGKTIFKETIKDNFLLYESDGWDKYMDLWLFWFLHFDGVEGC